MAKPRTPPGKPPRPAEPPKDAAAVLSVRIAPSKVAALDVWVAELNADPDNPGRVTRNSLIVHLIEQALTARAKDRQSP